MRPPSHRLASGRRRWACPPRSSTLTTLLKTQGDTHKATHKALNVRPKKKKKKDAEKNYRKEGVVLAGPLVPFWLQARANLCLVLCSEKVVFQTGIYCPQRQYEAMKRALAHQPLLDPQSYGGTKMVAIRSFMPPTLLKQLHLLPVQVSCSLVGNYWRQTMRSGQSE